MFFCGGKMPLLELAFSDKFTKKISVPNIHEVTVEKAVP
jgi:hypothetical protein